MYPCPKQSHVCGPYGVDLLSDDPSELVDTTSTSPKPEIVSDNLPEEPSVSYVVGFECVMTQKVTIFSVILAINICNGNEIVKK